MPTRRTFLKQSGAALTTALVAKAISLPPAEAKAQRQVLAVLTPAEATTLEAFAELIVPGAAKAGVAHYVDQQLAAPPHESMLMLKYLSHPVSPDFYRRSLAALDRLAQADAGHELSKMSATAGAKLADQVFSGQANPWTQAPPSAFVFFVLRADATDVVYGTVEGFSRIGQSYRPHIAPPTDWSK